MTTTLTTSRAAGLLRRALHATRDFLRDDHNRRELWEMGKFAVGFFARAAIVVIVIYAAPNFAYFVDTILDKPDREQWLSAIFTFLAFAWSTAYVLQKIFRWQRRGVFVQSSSTPTALARAVSVPQRPLWTTGKTAQERLIALNIALSTKLDPFTERAIALSSSGASAAQIAEQGPELWRTSVADRHVQEQVDGLIQHEAGHAIVAHELGAAVLEVTVEQGHRGHTRIDWMPGDGAHTWQLAVLLAAGLIQQQRAGVDADADLHATDSREFFAEIDRLVYTGIAPAGVDEATRESLAEAAKAQAREILERRAADVAAMAEHLNEHRVISGFALRDLLAGSR